MLDRAAATTPAWQPHRLHDPARAWPETNCYVDLWIEVLAHRGFDPTAALGFTIRQDFEGDQFTFFKFPLDDLERLFGVSVQELSVFDSLERHTLEQLARGRLVLIEVDGYYLPDTAGVSYRLTHPKTTIAVTALDPARRCLAYFHNAGHFELDGEDFDGVFRRLPRFGDNPDVLFPYVEFAKFEPSPASRNLPAIAWELLKRHWAFRPRQNPVAAYRARFPEHAADLAGRDPEHFHIYAFNTLRQLGANFGLLADHLDWLEASRRVDFGEAPEAAHAIADGAKAFQFQLARAMARNRLTGLEAQLDPIAAAWDRLDSALSGVLGA